MKYQFAAVENIIYQPPLLRLLFRNLKPHLNIKLSMGVCCTPLIWYVILGNPAFQPGAFYITHANEFQSQNMLFYVFALKVES